MTPKGRFGIVRRVGRHPTVSVSDKLEMRLKNPLFLQIGPLKLDFICILCSFCLQVKNVFDKDNASVSSFIPLSSLYLIE